MKSIHNKLTNAENINLGFDALVDFAPNGREKNRMKFWSISKNYFYRFINKLISTFHLVNRISKLSVSYVYSYESLMNKSIRENCIC